MKNKNARRSPTDAAPTGSSEGLPVPDEHLIVGATVVLAKHAGKLTNRSADGTTRQIIARDWVAQLQLSGYRITFGPGSVHHSTPAGPPEAP